jgi:hypothetical protein
MTRMQALLQEVESLPLDQQMAMVDHVLRSLHGVTAANDRAWQREAEKRLRETGSGIRKTIAGDRDSAAGQRSCHMRETS